MLLKADNIGPVQLGVSKEELVSSLSEIPYQRKDYYSEEAGNDHTDFVIELCENSYVTANFYSEEILYSIETQSSAFLTVEGAHVGMTAEELKNVYPEGKFINAWNEGVRRFFIIDDGKHGVFTFDSGRCVDDGYDVSSECNAVLPSELSVRYWTNSSYTKPGVWKNIEKTE
ncbi:MAG: hypothetical protein DHS20C05_18700 [Hyphococcus sp.]|nr:MAG: hypothetical protein DHS20C05_18700 [Marinicaulis sp.]